MKKIKNYIVGLGLPILYYGALTGILTAALVVLYKWCVVRVVEWSSIGYAYVRAHLWVLAIVLPALFGLAALFAWAYKKMPNLRGGGIPTSVGVLRGLLTFRWLRNLIGVFVMSLCSFLIGVPLGNEGPSVQMGVSVGGGLLAPMGKRQKGWGRYAMTGGACVGFATATGAPISGILFAVEEAHERVSPVLLMVATVSVVFGRITSECLSPLLGVSQALFHVPSTLALGIGDLWLPILIGLAFGLFATLFLKYHQYMRAFVQKTLKKVGNTYKIFAVFFLTVVLGLLSTSFVSTGHAFVESLFATRAVWWFLLAALAVRSTLTLFANVSGVTGGIFLPTIAIGVALAALLGELFIGGFGLGEEYYILILALGIVACIAGMMKMPITAIVFAVEALSCYNNILHVIVVVAVAFFITELLGAHSIGDNVLHARLEENAEGKHVTVFESFVCVQAGAFAVGKQIRDILWPANMFVLSVAHPSNEAKADGLGSKVLRAGDVLHIRYSTYDKQRTEKELFDLVGQQTMQAEEIERV